jgi:hypothetical protein
MEMLTFKQYLSEKHCWKGYVKRGMKKKGNRMVNNCVKEDVDRPVLGVVEEIHIDGIGSVAAKIDSGNEAYNVLHGLNIVDNNDGTITFDTINNKQHTAKKTGSININIGSGNIESRPTIELSFVLKEKPYHTITFSVADRADNEQQVLIGEPFVRHINALIDVKK